MQKAYVNDTAFEYRVAEPDDPVQAVAVPTIVLLHGFPMDSRIWANVADELASEYRVISPNLRGFGTFTADAEFTIDSLADDVHALLHEIGGTPCVLAGLSMGGYVALSFAARHAESLTGLVLVASKAEADDDAARRRRDETLDLLQHEGVPALVEQMHPKLVADQTLRDDPALVETLCRIMLDTPLATAEEACRAMRDRTDRTSDLASLDLPVGIVAGEADEVIPLNVARAMADRVRDVEFTSIANAGHVLPLERPREVADAIRSIARRSR